MRTELDDLSQMMKDVEELNRDLRQALKDATLVKKQVSSCLNLFGSGLGGIMTTITMPGVLK